MLPLQQIQSQIESLAARINAPQNILPTYGRSEDFARPHIEADPRGFHYVIIERGEERHRATTSNLDDLLYLVFSDITHSLALNYELRHRIETQDSRRLWFAHQVQLLNTLSPSWAARQAKEQDRILKEHPFNDP